MREFIEGGDNLPQCQGVEEDISEFNEKHVFYKYDFGHHVPYHRDGRLDEAINFIIAKYFNNETLGVNGLKYSGFFQKQSQLINGGSRSYFHLMLSKDIPRWIVQSLFNDLMLKGIIYVRLGSEKYPRTPRKPTIEQCVEGERIEKILESVRDHILASDGVIRPDIPPYKKEHEEERQMMNEREARRQLDPWGWATDHFPGGPCPESGDI